MARGDLRQEAGGGTGLLAIFCELDAEWHAGFRGWLTEDMFPARRAIGFGACASYDAVPFEDGPTVPPPAFLTVYEMPSLGDLYGEPYHALRRDRDERDAAFHRRMQRMQRYTLNWTGPGLQRRGGAFAPFVLVDRFDLPGAAIQPFNYWFVEQYLPACAALDGVWRVRRYLTMEGAPAHFVLHEFADAAVLDDAGWRAVRQAPERALARDIDGSPGLYTRAVADPR